MGLLRAALLETSSESKELGPLSHSPTASLSLEASRSQWPTKRRPHRTTTPEAAQVIEKGCKLYPPPSAVFSWYYNFKSDGPYKCINKNDTKSWTLLTAYRSGGTQGVHWKYTDDPNDPECLTYWTYFTSDGNSINEFGIERTTFNGDTRRWCALPVYRSGGVKGKQWDYCLGLCDIN